MFLGFIDTLVGLKFGTNNLQNVDIHLVPAPWSVFKMTFISTNDGMLVERNVLATGSSC